MLYKQNSLDNYTPTQHPHSTEPGFPTAKSGKAEAKKELKADRLSNLPLPCLKGQAGRPFKPDALEVYFQISHRKVAEDFVIT
jgi:hypothetical protein